MITPTVALTQPESAEQQILRLEREMTAWQAASPRKGPMPHLTLFAGDWTGVSSRGARYDRTGGLALVDGGRFTSFVVDDLQVRTYGDAAVASGRLRFSGTFGGMQATDRSSLFTNTWVHVDGHWQQVASQFTSISAQ